MKKKQATRILRKKVDKEIKSGNTNLDALASTTKENLLEGHHPGKKFEKVAQPGITPFSKTS